MWKDEKNMETLLTISIAAYNVEKYIATALESCILSENLMELLEVCIIDDGSKDNTSVIAKEYVQRFPKAFKYYFKENGGYGSTVNYALTVAQGKYFRLLDGDDWYSKEELEEYLKYLQKCDSDLILSDYSIIYEKSKRVVSKRNFNYIHMHEYNVFEFDSTKRLAMYSFCYKTKLLQKNNILLTEHCFYTDMEFMLLPLQFIKSFIYVNVNLYQYRIGMSEQSVSIGGMRKHYEDYYKVFMSLRNRELVYAYSAHFCENIDTVIKNNITIMAKASYRSLMCLPISYNTYSKIKKLDIKIEQLGINGERGLFNMYGIPKGNFNFLNYIFTSILTQIIIRLKSL